MLSKKEQAFALFSEGKRPNDEEVQALKLKGQTRFSYFQKWKEGAGGDGQQSPAAASPSSSSGGRESLINAVKVTIVPKTTTISSIMLWQAMQAAINEWEWPEDMTVEHFLDRYLYVSFKQRGITLGGYTVTTIEEGDDGREPPE